MVKTLKMVYNSGLNVFVEVDKIKEFYCKNNELTFERFIINVSDGSAIITNFLTFLNDSETLFTITES